MTINIIIILGYILLVTVIEYKFKPFRNLYHLGKEKVPAKDPRMRQCTFITGMICCMFVLMLGTINKPTRSIQDSEVVSQEGVTTETSSREVKMGRLNDLLGIIQGIDSSMNTDYLLSFFVQSCNEGTLDYFEDTLYTMYVKKYSCMDEAYELTKALGVKVPINLVSGSPAATILTKYVMISAKIETDYSDEVLYNSQLELAQSGVTVAEYQRLRDNYLLIINNRTKELRENKYKEELEDYSDMSDSLYDATVEFEDKYLTR